MTFDQEMALEAAPHRIELSYHGPNHHDGNIFIYLPAQRVEMLVDVIVPGWVPFHALGGATDVAGYLDAHDTALSYLFGTLVAGHLTRTGTARDVRVQRAYLDDVRRACTGRGRHQRRQMAIRPRLLRSPGRPRGPGGAAPLDRPARRRRRQHPQPLPGNEHRPRPRVGRRRRITVHGHLGSQPQPTRFGATECWSSWLSATRRSPRSGPYC